MLQNYGSVNEVIGAKSNNDIYIEIFLAQFLSIFNKV
jgi:hypothetical protein